MMEMDSYVDFFLGNYAILSKEDIDDNKDDNSSFKGFWIFFLMVHLPNLELE
jgi:hypothetical protein